MTAVPAPEEIVSRTEAYARTLSCQAEAIRLMIQKQQELENAVVNMKCQAYLVREVKIMPGEVRSVSGYVSEFGAGTVLAWYEAAANNKCPEWEAMKYLSGCAKNRRASEVRS